VIKELSNTLLRYVGLESFVRAIFRVEHKSANGQLKVKKMPDPKIRVIYFAVCNIHQK